MKKVLLTGFMPFGGESINPSWEAVKKVHASQHLTVIREELPVTFHGAQEKLRMLMDAHRPDYVISVGQAGGRKAVTVEYVAVNLMDGTDNDGVRMTDAPVENGGENALFSTLPVRDMVQAARDAGIAAARSLSAGAYVCNCVMYAALAHAQRTGADTCCGFVHVPFIPEQTQGKDAPSMPLQDIVKALEAMLSIL